MTTPNEHGPTAPQIANAKGWLMVRAEALSFLTTLPDESVDAVVTDPPYSSGGAFRSDRGGSARAKYLQSGSKSIGRLPDFDGDSRTERGLLLWSALWLGECYRVTRPGGAIAVFCDWRSLPTFSDALQTGGWVWRGIGVWVKPASRARPVMGGLWNDTEFILWGSKGARTEGECLPGVWHTAAPSSGERLHVTEKPQAILVDLVRLAPPGGVVLDPFAGSGSTGVAALTTDRRFIGCDSSPEYSALADERLSVVTTSGADMTRAHGPSLFSPPDDTPTPTP